MSSTVRFYPESTRTIRFMTHVNPCKVNWVWNE